MASDDELELECIRALAGADVLKSKILSGLMLGNPSVSETAYLVKCRVKTLESLKSKVKDRRLKNSAYKPSSATDVIGLRLLSLYRRDLPGLVRKLIDFVKAGQSEHFGLFSGRGFKEACTEIIVYSPQKYKNTRIENLILEQFRGEGLDVLADDEKEVTDSTPDSLRVRLVRRDNEYSSVHIIVYCFSRIENNLPVRIPMEIQIRTSLEDIWGEIDHQLKYKYADAAVAELMKKIRDNALTNLKGYLDLCAESADNIAGMFDELDVNGATPGSQIAPASVDYGQLLKFVHNQAEKKSLLIVLEILGDAYKHANDHNYIKNRESSEEISLSFESCAEKIAGFFEALPPSQKTDDAFYCFKMEKGLCHYWAARVLSPLLLDNGQSTEIVARIKRNYDKAFMVYSEIRRSKHWSTDPILLFRLAVVMSAQGEQRLALNLFEEAYAGIDQIGEGEDLSIFKLRIPRQYGVALWEEAERLKDDALKVRDPQLFIRQRRDCYTRALKVTLPLLSQNSGIGLEEAESLSRRETINNIVEYALSFLRVGGGYEDLAKIGLGQEKLLEYVTILGGEDEDSISEVASPVWLDTLRSAYRELVRNPKLCRIAAERLIGVLEANRGHWLAQYGERWVDEMLDDARKDLSSSSSK